MTTSVTAVARDQVPGRSAEPLGSAAVRDHALDGPEASASDRVALARAALRTAEERTGAGSWVRPVRPQQPPAPLVTRAVHRPDQEPVHAPTPGPDPQAVGRRLPVPGSLAPLLPSGGLDRGVTVVVAGSTSLALALLSEVSRAGGWVALVGMPAAGVLAARQLGLDLDRVALVPRPGPDAATAVAALLDGVDVVVVGPQSVLGDADRRRLSARARERGTVLLPTTAWPGAHVVLTAGSARWEGLGRGDGRLRSRRLTVQRTGRGAAASGGSHAVVLPAAPHARVEQDGGPPVVAGTAPPWTAGRRAG